MIKKRKPCGLKNYLLASRSNFPFIVEKLYLRNINISKTFRVDSQHIKFMIKIIHCFLMITMKLL